MDTANQLRIRKNFETISTDLSVSDIQDALIEKGVFTTNEMEEICTADIRIEQVRKLLYSLLRSTNQAYEGFRACLEQNYKWLLTGLDETEVTEEEIQREEALVSNLPQLIPTYIGRQKEEDEIINTLLTKSSSIVTITGLGGNGKSTVAKSVGHKMSKSGFRVLFLSLRKVSDLQIIITGIFSQLNVSIPDNSKDKLEILCHILRKQNTNTLIIIDNAEDVQNEQTNDDYMQILQNLFAIDSVQILITSRNKIHSTAFNIEDIPLPGLTSESSKSLVQTLVPNIDVDDACVITKACGGSPLALQLIAASLKSTADVEAVVADLKAKLLKQTERAVGIVSNEESLSYCISSCYNPLTENEKCLFRRIGIFPDTFGIEAAKAMCDIPQETSLILSSLINRSMCSYDANTKLYSLHPLLKHFSTQEMKTRNEENHIIRLFTTYGIRKICQLSRTYWSQDWASAEKALEVDQKNVEHALHLLAKHPELYDQCQLLSQQHVHQFLPNFISKQTRKTFYTCAAEHEGTDQLNKASFLSSLADIAYRENNRKEALKIFLEIEATLQIKFDKQINCSNISFSYYQAQYAYYLAITGELDRARSVVKCIHLPECTDNMSVEELYLLYRCHYFIGFVYAFLDDDNQSLAHFEKAKSTLVNHLLLESHPYIIGLITMVADKMRRLGRLEEAESTLQEAAVMCVECGKGRSVKMLTILTSTAHCLTGREKYQEAQDKCKEALKMAEELGLENTHMYFQATHALGQALYRTSKYSEAKELFEKSVEYLKGRGEQHNTAVNLSWKGRALRGLSRLQEAVDAYTEALEIEKRINSIRLMIVEYQNLCDVYQKMGEHSKAKDCQKELKCLRQKQRKSDIPSSEANPVTVTLTHTQPPGANAQADMNISTVTTQAASPKQYPATKPNPQSPVLETLSTSQISLESQPNRPIQEMESDRNDDDSECKCTCSCM